MMKKNQSRPSIHTRYGLAEQGSIVSVLIEQLAQAYWNLYADSIGQTVFDQYADEDGVELFDIETREGVAMRHYRYDGRDEWTPLFQGDLHDLLIVGFVEEYGFNEYDID